MGAGRVTMMVGSTMLFGVMVHFQAPSLTGTWALDKGKSTGVGPFLIEQALIVRSEVGRLMIDSRFTTPQGPVVVSDTLTPDGVAREFTLRRITGQEGPGRRSARWLIADRTLEVADSAVLDGPAGPYSRLTIQHWTIDSATSRLFQDVTVRVPPFTTLTVHNEFVRK